MKRWIVNVRDETEAGIWMSSHQSCSATAHMATEALAWGT
jgi:hypothetical protein